MARRSRKRCAELLARTLFVAGSFFGPSAIASPQFTRILGGDGPNSIVVAVLAEGYTSEELPTFRADVNRLIVQGLLENDVYKAHKDSFTVYRIDLVSADSGIGETGSPRDTALGLSYNGTVQGCWFDLAPDTDARVDDAVAALPRYDYAYILANTRAYGGCSRDRTLYSTSGSGWTVLAHELGHSIGRLLDEYSVDANGAYRGSPVNERNCTTSRERTAIVWKDLIDSKMPIPTTTAGATGVGAYPGCEAYGDNIYHPFPVCRMNEQLDQAFCPVCKRLMSAALAQPHPSALVAFTGAELSPGKSLTPTEIRIRITSTGGVRVVGMVPLAEAPTLVSPPSTGTFYELVQPNGRIIAGHLDHDPFLARSYAPPGTHGGHVDVPAKDATITIVAPVSASFLDTPGTLNFFKVNSTNPPEPRPKPTEGRLKGTKRTSPLDVFRQTHRLELEHSITPQDFGDALKVFEENTK